MSPDDFRAWARGGPVLIDGGLSTVLEEAGVCLPPSDDLWTSRLLLDDPEALKNAHARYLHAGAQVILTATYQATQKELSRFAS